LLDTVEQIEPLLNRSPRTSIFEDAYVFPKRGEISRSRTHNTTAKLSERLEFGFGLSWIPAK
jgi:hypothetical protein